MKLDYGHEEYSNSEEAVSLQAFYVFIKYGKTVAGRQDHKTYMIKHYAKDLEEVKSFFSDKKNIKICKPNEPNLVQTAGTAKEIEGSWFVTYIFCPAENKLWASLMRKTFDIVEITNLEHDRQALSFWHQTEITINQLRIILDNPIQAKWPFKFSQIVSYWAMKRDAQGALSMSIPLRRSRMNPVKA